MEFRRVLARYPLATGLVFEGLMVPLALVLAWLLGLQPWTGFSASPGVLLAGVAATLPLLVALAVCARQRPGWFDALERQVRPLVEMLFRGRGSGPVIAVAALAGLGEELLFRGVLQAWLVGFSGPVAGVLLASALFGLVHAVTPAYFVLATAMGLYLGVLYHLTGSLLLVALVHALYDWVALEYLVRTAGPAPTQEAEGRPPDRDPAG
jgi:hypothetical protein